MLSAEKGKNRAIVKVELPVGTTQLMYLVSFSDKATEVRSSLASALSGPLKPVGAVLSAINTAESGNKGTIYIFKTGDEAKKFKNYATYRSCNKSSADIPSEKNYLKLNENGCLTSNTDYLYFGFYNGNSSDEMNIKIELMPWIDNTASKGWSKTVKEDFMNRCLDKYKDKTQPEEVCQCVLEKLQENYKYQDFKQMIESETNKIESDLIKDCDEETGEDENQLDIERDYADSLAENGQYGEAINKLLPIIESGKADAMDFNDIGYYHIMTKQYLKAIKYLKDGEKLDETELYIKGNLAHSYLLNGDVDLAKAIYLKYKTQNVDDKTTWIEMVKSDFEVFKKNRLPSDNFDLITSLLK